MNKRRFTKAQAEAGRDFILRLVVAKDEAGRLGLWKTMHALDEVTRTVGYEVADLMSVGEGTAP
jgi:hypothetical protein